MRTLGFIVDKITNSIEDANTGKSYSTEVVLATLEDIKSIHKKDGWFFNWKKEYIVPNHQIYKLLIQGHQTIQGLLSLEPIKQEQFIEMHLIENSPANFGQQKAFVGVAGNLVAFACRLSFEMGFDGMMAFTAKTKLIGHYQETLGARLIYGMNRMGIFSPEAKKLVNSYYK